MEHIEIYKPARYENISDRIKRLNSSNQTGLKNINNPIPSTAKKNTYLNRSKNQYSSPDTHYLSKLEDKTCYSRTTTQQTQGKSDQQSFTLINDFLTFKENDNVTNKYKNGKGIANMTNRTYDFKHKNIEDQQSRNNLTENRNNSKIDQQNLNKVKSDSNLKVEEILQSYNSYKLNKQKFIESISKNAHQRSQTVKIHEHIVNDISSIYQSKVNKQESVFEQIQQIWNLQSVNEKQESEFVPKFQRSKNIAVLNSKIYERNEDMNNLNIDIQLNEPRSISRSKIVKNYTRRQIKIEQKPFLNIQSPRGVRIPGKIIKNNDRTFTSPSAYHRD